MYNVWASENAKGTDRADDQPPKAWALYLCATCGGGVVVEGTTAFHDSLVANVFPAPRIAHEDVPSVARTFLQQAFDVLHAPDAAAVMAGSAVDAMLKAKGYHEGSLYSRIDKAREDGLLTQGMAEWAHSVRLGSNRPRHADVDRPHVNPDEAKQSVEFAEALGSFLFVLTARIERGIAAAETAEAAATT